MSYIMAACWTLYSLITLLLTATLVSGQDGQEGAQQPVPADVFDDGALVPATPSELPEEEAEYKDHLKVKGADNKYCLIADFSATFTIRYKSKNGSVLSLTDQLLSSDMAQWSGECDESESAASLSVKWHGGDCELKMRFSKDDKNWFASALSYHYLKSDKSGFIKPANSGVRTAQCPPGTQYLTSPLGSYHWCDAERGIDLVENDSDTVQLHLTDVRVQAFRVAQSGEFDHSTKHECSGGPQKQPQKATQTQQVSGSRSTAAVAVGICVALVTVGVVVGYAARRYYRERISYSTM